MCFLREFVFKYIYVLSMFLVLFEVSGAVPLQSQPWPTEGAVPPPFSSPRTLLAAHPRICRKNIHVD